MHPRRYLSILITLVLQCSPFINAHAQTTLSPCFVQKRLRKELPYCVHKGA